MHERMNAVSGYTRRDFLRGSLLTAGALALGGCATLSTPPPRVRKPGEKLNLAGIGCGGKGESDIQEMMHAGMRVLALCDVDEGPLKRMADQVRRENNPDVRLYRDFRELLAKEPLVDACTISTPDHMHAPAAALAMSLGKHVYVQKPLTHTMWEARRLRDLARRTRVVTQMGNQGSAANELRRGVEVIQAGVLGPVQEVHVWTNRPVWPQGLVRPSRVDPVPPALDWNLWLGVAPERPYAADTYHPFKWRGWYDFGTGALGDMACHTCNLPFRALNLGYASEVEAVTEGATAETYPKHAKVTFQFPARPNPAKPGERLPPVTFYWYEGGWKPDAALLKDLIEFRGEIPMAGCYLVGQKGRLFSAGDYGDGNSLRLNDEPKFRSILKHDACLAVPQTLPRSPGNYKEWADACYANAPDAPYSRFEISAYLTEIILVGCIALRLPGKIIQWDGPRMRSPNTPEAAALVHPPYRPGWRV